MARVTHVRRAQQRYENPAVLDSNGQPVYTETARKTKSGQPVRVVVTTTDKTKPLPDRICESCRKPIPTGTAYKWVKPKTGPRGGSKRYRHETCPDWQSWDLSNSLAAQIDLAVHNYEEALSSLSAGTPDAGDFKSAADDFAAEIRELADAKHEAASNIVDGFGHETYQSEELESLAGELESWADDIEGFEEPDYPEAEDEDCETCGLSGEVECDNCNGEGEVLDDDSEQAYADCPECGGSGQSECPDCDGRGKTERDEPSDEAIEEWAENCMSEAEALTEGRPA